MSMSGIPVASEIEAHRQVGVHVPAQPPDVHGSTKHDSTVIFSICTYTGNGTGNQAVAHGLGRTPVRVISLRQDAYQFVNINGTTWKSAGGTDEVGTAWDGTNIYVGGAAGGQSNINTYKYLVILW